MSKKSKETARLKRKQERDQKKAAKRAKHSLDFNKKLNLRSRAMAPGHPHRNGSCGNIGCLRCSPTAQRAKLRMLSKTSGKKAIDRFIDKLER